MDKEEVLTRGNINGISNNCLLLTRECLVAKYQFKVGSLSFIQYVNNKVLLNEKHGVYDKEVLPSKTFQIRLHT